MCAVDCGIAVNPDVIRAQMEGGSRAIPTNYKNMRIVGAGGRLLMLAAAAQQWGVPQGELTTAGGVVSHAASRRTATYASLAARAASLTPPDVAAAEAAVGLAIVVALFRHRESLNPDAFTSLKW